MPDDDPDVRKILSWDGHRYLPIPYDWFARARANGGSFEEIEIEPAGSDAILIRPHRRGGRHGQSEPVLSP